MLKTCIRCCLFVAFKNLLNILSSDSDASVYDRNSKTHFVVRLINIMALNGDFSLLGELDCISHKVEKDLIEFTLVTHHHLVSDSFFHIQVNAYLLEFALGLHQCQDVVECHREREWLRNKSEFA